MKNAREYHKEVFDLMQKHHDWFQSCIPLIASENIPSLAVREALISDFGNRYAEGWPGERIYAGCTYIDQVELMCMDLAKKLYEAEFVDVRPISGVVANLVVYAAFAEPGDLMLALSIPSGGHISTGKKRLGGTAGAIRGLDVEYLPLNEKELNIDVDETIKRTDAFVKEGKIPKLVMFGGSVLPFPHPIKELEEYFHNLETTIVFDAAHVAGLIAGKKFQDPLSEGADVMTVSTHKTMPGPQHGMVVSWEKYADKIKRATFPGLVSNHHLHNVAGVVIALAEMLEFGEEYASQIVRNSKALGQALYERGLNVLAENKGFTESHVLLIDITKHGDGGTLEEQLEKANIILNRNLLPWDIREGRHFMHPGGIRLGTSEVTRLGMKENDMNDIADFIKRIILDKETPETVIKDITEFRKDFQNVHYCFEKATEAYSYIKLVNQ
ncbi:MAG: serine hydroxymethyltransferase [Candidatus Bathyarchaeota archaeon]|nr:serine hydroxymethyltransferase [Candidatus Bathyarchaeota archaeon]